MKHIIILLFSLTGWMAGAFAQGVTQGEYFWGSSDPGNGNGIALTAPEAGFGNAIQTVLANAVPITSEGPALFNLRVREQAGGWGPVFSVVVNGDAPFITNREIKVTQAEYFWGSDPGAGAGMPMFALDGNLDNAIETIVNTAIEVAEEPTVEVLSIRVRDAENVWGPVFSVVVSIEPAITTSREIKVTAAEYYFNDDPGAGNGTAMLAVDGNFNNAIKALRGAAIPAPIEQGVHVLWMRARDAENVWGPSFGVVVNMDTTITGLNAQINGQTIFCQGASLTSIPYSTPATGGSTYVWTATNGAVVSGQGSPSVTLNWNPSGNRTLTLTQCLGSSCETETITITVNPTFTAQESETICQGQSIFLGGANQTQAGVYTDVFQTVNGCDSTVVTTLSVIQSIQTEQAVTLCNGESLFVGGSNQTTSGTYVDTYTLTSGCDSVVTTQLTVLAPIQVNQNAQICQGGSIFLAGDFQSAPGLYTELFTSAFGCDSVVVTNLSITPAPIIEQTVEICPGQSYFVGGADQTQPGVYSDLEVDSNGCETVLLTTLVVESSVVIPQSVEICAGQSFFVGGANQTTSGLYNDTTIDGEGCEITIATTLTVLPPAVQAETATICQGGSIILGGAEQTTSGVYSDFTTNAEGCTVEVQTTLTVTPAPVTTATAEICEGGSIFLGGANQTTEGVYTDITADPQGCTVVLETTLSIVEQIQVNVSAGICPGDSLFAGGAWQNQPGTYTDLFEGEGGCDSLVTTTLSLLPPFVVNTSETICQGDSIFLGGNWQFTAGSFADNLTSVNGCDSLVLTQLAVLSIALPQISLSAGVLTTGQFASYQWFFNGEPIEGATNQFFVPEEQGLYTVEVTAANGCSRSSAPFSFITDGVFDAQARARLVVFPNPGTGSFTVETPTSGANLEIFDLTGRMVHAAIRRTEHHWSVDLTGNASGTYLFVISSPDGIKRQRVVLAN